MEPQVLLYQASHTPHSRQSPSCPCSLDLGGMHQHSHCCFFRVRWWPSSTQTPALEWRTQAASHQEDAAVPVPSSWPHHERQSISWFCRESWRRWHRAEHASFKQQQHHVLEPSTASLEVIPSMSSRQTRKANEEESHWWLFGMCLHSPYTSE